MAWVSITPNPTGGGSNAGSVDFTVYRVFRGTINARLTDVSYASDTFAYAHIGFQLVNSSGVVRAGATLSKQWGVLPGWSHLGVVSPGGESLKFRIATSSYVPSNIIGMWFNFTMQVRYDATLV